MNTWATPLSAKVLDETETKASLPVKLASFSARSLAANAFLSPSNTEEVMGRRIGILDGIETASVPRRSASSLRNSTHAFLSSI